MEMEPAKQEQRNEMAVPILVPRPGRWRETPGLRRARIEAVRRRLESGELDDPAVLRECARRMLGG